MFNNEIKDKCIQLKDIHKLKFGATNQRPWGSWDLVMFKEGNKDWWHTGQTFGWAYTDEEALVSFFEKVYNQQVNEDVKNYLGYLLIEEIKKIFTPNEVTVEQIPDAV